MPSPTYTLIQSTTLVSNTSTIDFTSIPQGYYDLRLHYSIRATGGNYGADLPMLINNTSNVYRQLIIYPDTTSNIRGYRVGYNGSTYATAVWAAGGNIPAVNAIANAYSDGTLLIPGYTNTTNLTKRSIGGESFTITNNSVNPSWQTNQALQTSSPSAVSRLTFTLDAGYGLIAAGSTISLYGCTNS